MVQHTKNPTKTVCVFRILQCRGSMPMWHFVVCDDEENCRREVVENLRNILKELRITDDTYDITEYSSLAQLQKRAEAPTVLLLDVAFDNEEDGTQAAVAFRYRWPNMLLIFVSSMEAYVWKSFRAYAMYYVLKKDIDEQLRLAIEQAIQLLRKQPPVLPDIPFKIGWSKEPYMVPITDILYILWEDRHLNLYLKKSPRHPRSPVSYLGTIKKETARLEKYGMYHVHKALLVNLANIKDVQRDCIEMCDGTMHPINSKIYRPLRAQWLGMKEAKAWNTFSHS